MKTSSSTTPFSPVVKKWHPKTQAGRLTKAGAFKDYEAVRSSRFDIKEPEIADYFFGDQLVVAPLKVVPIGDGQYRYKAFVAVGDGKNYVGLGQRCGKDRKTAEEGASRNAKLNLRRICKSWIVPVTGEHGGTIVTLHPHAQLIGRPILKRVLSVAGVVNCKAEANTERDSPNIVLALFKALKKLEVV